MRTVYLPYRTMRDRLLREVVKTTSKKKKRSMTREDMVRDIMQVSLTPNSISSFPMESDILIEEEAYFENGCPMFFPESAAMLEMLWRSKMNLDLEDLDLTKIPSTFSIAWPRCEIDGSPLSGVMVSIMTAVQHKELLSRVSGKYLDIPLGLEDPALYADTQIRIFITYFENRSASMGQPLYHCCIPGPFVAKVLKDEAEFTDLMDKGKWHNKMSYVWSLEPKEQHQQFVMAKLVMALLVYMQACPEYVRPGLPDGRKQKEFTVPHGSVTGNVLGCPRGLGGTHASPGTHWRSWHFRSYPKRADGSKRKGVVRVKGTVVGGDIDPHTVEDEAIRPRFTAHTSCIVR